MSKELTALKKDFKQSVGDSAYNNWIKHLSFVSYENNTLSFSLPTKFLRDWIVNNYADKIKIESKDEMRKRGIKSPDKADALALTMASSAASFGGSTSFLGYNFRQPLKSKIIRIG